MAPPPWLTKRRAAALALLLVLLCATSAVVTVRLGGAGRGSDAAPARGGPSGPVATAATPAISGTSEAPAASPGVRQGFGPVSPAPPTVRPAARPGAKKGASTWEWPHSAAALADVRASWFYNWSPGRERTPGPATVEFVPMIWGARSVTPAELARAGRNGRVLLGFNEPDLAEQANMSVEQALDLWPKLQATGLRLGSPVPAFGGDTAGGWLDRFMSGARARGYRVDFIALHWYGSDFRAEAATGHLRGYLQKVYDRYRLPIWLTEYALMSFGGGAKYPSADEQAAFVRTSTAMLEGLPFVERYAWFSLPFTADAGTGLYRDGSNPTPAGVAYRSV